MIRKLCIAAIASVYLISAATAGISAFGYGAFSIPNVSGSSPPSVPQWHDLSVGGGGFEPGIAIAPDGTMLARSDTAPGIWLCSAKPCRSGAAWFPINNPVSNPDVNLNTAGGLLEMAIAPSNTAVFGMMFNGFVYITQDSGQTWVKEAGFSQVTLNPNDFAIKIQTPYMQFDPLNPNILWVSTPSGNLFKTTTALSPNTAIWTAVTAVGTPSNPTNVGNFPSSSQGGGFLIIYDSVTSGCTTPIAGVSQCIYVETFGTGWFHSTDGGTTWTAISNASICSGTTCPFTHITATLDSNGKLWTTDYQNATNNLWRYFSGTWTRITSIGGAQLQTIAIDPGNPNNAIAISNSAFPITTSNGGVAWNTFGSNGGPIASTDAPWQITPSWSFITAGGLQYDPSQSGVVYMSTGQTILYSNPLASNTTINWTTIIKNLETLDGANIVAAPNGTVFGLSDDYPIWPITPGTLPSVYGITYLGVTVALSRGASLSQAPDNANLDCYVLGGEGTLGAGCSTDGGATWPTFASIPSGATSYLGEILALDSATPDILWIPQGVPPNWTQTTTASAWTVSSDGSAPFKDAPCGNICKAASVDNTGKIWLFNQNTGSNLEPQGLHFSTDKGHTFSPCNNGPDPAGASAGGLITIVALKNSGSTPTIFYSPALHFVSQPDLSLGLYAYVGCGSPIQDTNWKSVMALGSGAACPGHTNDALYVVGYYNGVAPANWGVYQSCDIGATYIQLGTPSLCSATVVNFCNIPMENFGYISAVDGDKNIPGKVYISFNQGGFAAYY